MVPSTVVMPREESFALASFGRVRKVQEPTFAVAAGRKSFALKRILEAVLVIFAWYPDRNLLFGRCAVHSLNDVGFDAHAVSAPNDQASAARRCFWRRVGWMPVLARVICGTALVSGR
jgi:hypothetical protein